MSTEKLSFFHFFPEDCLSGYAALTSIALAGVPAAILIRPMAGSWGYGLIN